MADLHITWVKSDIGYRNDQKLTIRSLGLHRLHQTVVQKDTPQIMGMLAKVKHLAKVEREDVETA